MQPTDYLNIAGIVILVGIVIIFSIALLIQDHAEGKRHKHG